METKVNNRAVLVLVFMLLIFVGQSSAGYKECYSCCYPKCRAQRFRVWYCKYRCFLECISYPTPECGNIDQEVNDKEAQADGCTKNCTKQQKTP